MRDWRTGRDTDIGLRAGGAALCALSWLAIRALVHLRVAPWPVSPGLPALTLATAGFVCASLGGALLTLGRHIFDRIEIAAR